MASGSQLSQKLEKPVNVPDYVVIGKINKPHGVRGYLKVEPLTDQPERYKMLEKVHIRSGEQNLHEYKLENVQIAKGFLLIKLANISSREQAAALRGQTVEIPGKDVLPQPEGIYYFFEFIGLDVITDQAEKIGKIVDVIEFPANDVFVIVKDGREYMIPDVPDIVVKKNVRQGHIVIRVIEGLFD